jgi:hypothetical protein
MAANKGHGKNGGGFFNTNCPSEHFRAYLGGSPRQVDENDLSEQDTVTRHAVESQFGSIGEPRVNILEPELDGNSTFALPALNRVRPTRLEVGGSIRALQLSGAHDRRAGRWV